MIDTLQDTLLELVQKRFREAQQHRLSTRLTDGKTVEETLDLCHRAREQQFSEDYLRDAAEDDPLMYYPLTSTKVRAAAAHIYDILVNIMAFPISVMPTPAPELPPLKLRELAERMYDQWTGGGMNADDISREATRYKALGLEEIMRVAQDAATAHSILLKDQFTESNFNDVLLEFLDNFCLYPTGFFRQRMVMQDRMAWSKSSKPAVKRVMARRWEVVSPHDMFPSKDSVSTQNGTFIVVRESLTKKDFYEQKLLDSFDEEAVDQCLLEMGAVAEPPAESEEKQSQGKPTDVAGAGTSTNSLSDALTPRDPATVPTNIAMWKDTYSVTQYTHFGLITGAEAMMAKGIEGLEPNKFYESEITWCDKRRIRTVVYPEKKEGDPLGTRPIWSASYRSRGEAFWGEGGEKILRSLQRAANASFRDWMINNADAARPIGAVDFAAVNRYTSNPTDIHGGKMFLTDNDPTRPRGSSQNKIVEFTDIPNHSTLYIGSLGEVVRRSDEVFGIPAFGHGQSQVGTLGRTFNGMALVYGAALKDLKLSLRWLTKGVLTPIGQYNYNYNMKHSDNPAIQGDTQVVIAGPEGIVQRELSQMNFTTNMQQILPLVQAGLLPPEVAKYMASQWARESGVPVDLFIQNPLSNNMTPPSGAPGVPMPAPAASNPGFNQSIGAP